MMAINEIAIDYLQRAITLMQNEAYEVERPSKNGVSFNKSHKYYDYVLYYFKEVKKGKIFPPMYTKYYTKEMEEERRSRKCK